MKKLMIAMALILLLTSCASPAAVKAADPDAEVQAESITAKPTHRFNFPCVYSMSIRENAMSEVIKRLEKAGFRCELRHELTVGGVDLDADWLYAQDDDGRWLDVILSSLDSEKLFTVLYGNGGMSPDHPAAFRVNDAASWQRRQKAPHWISGLGAAVVNDNAAQSFSYCISGEVTACNLLDAGLDDGTGWDGTPAYVSEDGTVPSDFAVYTPEDTRDGELKAMQSRLTDTGRGYHWEVKDTITLDDREYPVRWMYAENENGEWLDVIFTEDTDLLYRLREDHGFLDKLRADQIEAMNHAHPGREEAARPLPFILQDQIDYGFVITGCTFALFDAGMVCQMEEWIDELGRYAGCESRDVIWGLNYEPDYENFK